MERIKSEYLQRILDQVNVQNTEYFENLACEYTLRLEQLKEKAPDFSIIKDSKPLIKDISCDYHQMDQDEPNAYANFMNKPEIIQMHLEILYKSITYLSKERITGVLANYKKAKELKRKEEEERLLMRTQMKKSRGRSGSRKSQTR